MESIRIAENIVQMTQEGQLMPTCLTALTGPDGLLLVDTGQRVGEEELRTAVANLGFEVPAFIINTHASLGNVGGNGAFGASPTILAHRGTRELMRGDSHLLAELPPEALPDIEIDGPMTLHFNGEEIRIVPMPGSHTPTDMIVHFVHAGVACVGDIYPGRFFPFSGLGGKAYEFPRVLREVAELLPAGTKLLYGHQPGPGSVDDFAEIIEMAEETIPSIRAGVEAGKDRQTLLDEGLPERWKHLDRPGASARGWIFYLFNDLSAPQPEQPSVLRPLYEAWKKDGTGEAIAAKFESLVAEGLDVDPAYERDLLRLGYWLLREQASPADAVAVFTLWGERYPESWNAFDSLAEGYVGLGKKELAIANYRKSLELNPDNENGKTELGKLGVEV